MAHYEPLHQALHCLKILLFLSLALHYQNADDKIFIHKFKKNVKSELYHIENSKTRGQTV